MYYVKKPIPIRAIQWNGPEDNEKCKPAAITCSGDPSWDGYEIETLESRWVRLIPGCWVVGPGAGGEFWPVQDHIFRATYELMEWYG